MIREATIADVPRLVEMGVAFLASTPYGLLLATHPDRIDALMRMLVENPVGVVFVSTDRAGALTGMLGGLCFSHVLSGEWVASELFWWVDPAARGTSAGVRLLDRAEAWARDQGVVALHMIAPLGSAVAHVYTRRGYAPVETAYALDLRAASIPRVA